MASYLDRVHQNPSPNLLKNIARNSAHENARIAIDKNNNFWAADGSKFLHKDLGNGPDYENIGTHKVVGYVTHHNGDYIVGAWDKGSSMTKPSSHEWLDKLFSHGFQNGTNDKDNFSDFARGGIISAFKADGGIVGDPDTDEGITAYHGSPHDFPRFDLSKIGTGEGAQAFGHGLYFAENEPVAKGYRDKLSEGTYKTDTGEIFDPYKNLEHMNVRVAAYKGIDPAIERAQGLLQSDPHDDRVHRDLEKLYALKAKNAAPHKGHMYEVHIEAHPDHFLDWDKPISEQSEHVQKAIRHIADQLDIDPFEHLALAAVVGRHPRSQTYSPRGEDLHTDIDEILGGKEHASKALHAAGIKGIRYLDAGSRPDGAYALHISHKGVPYTDPIPMKSFQQAANHSNFFAAKGYDTEIKENGSRNYVVFDDKLVNVKRKYAEGGAVDEAPDSWEDAFHATHADVRQFDLSKAGSGTTVGGGKAERAVFLTSDPENAKTYLGGQFVNRKNAPHTEEMPYGVGRHYDYGANIMPLRVNTKDFHEWDYGGNLYDANHMKEMIRQAKKDKAPGIKIENIKDQGYMGLGSGKKTTTYVVLDTSRLRSRFAKFDPKAAKKKDLGAKNGGSIVTRALMLTSKKA